MKVLLFGANGQLGYELRHLLASRVELSAPAREDSDFRRIDELGDLVRSVRPSVIVNAVAYNEVDGAESDPAGAMQVNANAVRALGAEAKRTGAALIHYSTDFVFDGEKTTPYTEDDETNPLGAYGASKRAGELALEEIEAPAIILRTAWVYSLRRKSFVSAMLKWARQRPELRVVSDQVGSPTWCRDLAEASVELIGRLGDEPGVSAREHRGIYHLAGSGQCSRHQLVEAMLKSHPADGSLVCKDVIPTTSDEFPAPAKRPKFAPLDCSRIDERLGIRLRPWQEGLSDALNSPPAPSE